MLRNSNRNWELPVFTTCKTACSKQNGTKKKVKKKTTYILHVLTTVFPLWRCSILWGAISVSKSKDRASSLDRGVDSGQRRSNLLHLLWVIQTNKTLNFVQLVGEPNELDIVPLSGDCKFNSGRLKWSQPRT